MRTEIFHPGDLVKHFKREMTDGHELRYIYSIVCYAHHSETGENLVIYRSLEHPSKICARPFEMFYSKVDKEKYPEVKQERRFELFDAIQDMR